MEMTFAETLRLEGGPRRHHHINRPRTRSLIRIAVKLQRWWRAMSRFAPTNHTDNTATRYRVRVGGHDVRCPISQDAIELPKCFRFVSTSGHVFAFSVDSLVAYLRSSGRFKCPCTQEVFNAIVVSRIERRAISAGLAAQGLRGVFEMRSAVLHRETEHSNRLLAYENSCGADLEEAIEICADYTLTRDRAMRYLQRDVMPQWRQTCTEYMRISSSACTVMLRSNSERLRRLSVIEDADVHGGLLQLVIDEVDGRLRVLDEARNHRSFLSAIDLVSSSTTAPDDMRWLSAAVFSTNNSLFGAGFGGGDNSTAPPPPPGLTLDSLLGHSGRIPLFNTPRMSLLTGSVRALSNFTSFNLNPVVASILGMHDIRVPLDNSNRSSSGSSSGSSSSSSTATGGGAAS